MKKNIKLKFKTIPTEVIFLEKIEGVLNQLKPNTLWIVDFNVISKNKEIKDFIKKQKLVYTVKAGESLKDIKHLYTHVAKILELTNGISHAHLSIVALGGGSVGDFAGFIASTFKRGVEFIQVPTTWLASVDSAHGGKNALNVGQFKNQVGTFYHPKFVFIVKKILLSQPEERFQEALGEIFKTALIDNERSWTSKIISKSNLTSKKIWQFLPQIIKAKYKVVEQDPFEKKGIRFKLNFGHTLAHALELKYKIPHGIAVSCGLKFAIIFSYQMKYLSQKEYNDFLNSNMFSYFNSLPNYKITQKEFIKLMKHDKKLDSNLKINFVFIKSKGKIFSSPIPIKQVSSALTFLLIEENQNINTPLETSRLC